MDAAKVIGAEQLFIKPQVARGNKLYIIGKMKGHIGALCIAPDDQVCRAIERYFAPLKKMPGIRRHLALKI